MTGHHQQFIARRALLIGSTICTLAACAPGADLQPLPDVQMHRYRIGVGDTVRLTVFGGDQLSGKFYVGDDGGISLPLLGEVSASGLTTQELSRQLATQLEQRKLFRNASVAVQVESFRGVFMLGEVSRPGQYPFFPGMTMLSAASVAGGFTYRAFTRYAEVVRLERDTTVKGKVQPSDFIAPGDVITFLERHF